MLTVLIPVYNEEKNITKTIRSLHNILQENGYKHEILAIYDISPDNTEDELKKVCGEIEEARFLPNQYAKGFGNSIRYGLQEFCGDYVAICMADSSDSPEDLIAFYQKALDENLDCVFGSRFLPEAKVVSYPPFKLFLNRIFNLFVKTLFLLKYNDFTNAFKLYSRKTITGISPLVSPSFNITVEMPLKAIVRGYSYAILPNDWINRENGVSNVKVKNILPRYLFIVFIVLLEKILTGNDFKK